MKSADKEKMGAYLKKLIEERYPSHRKFGKAYLEAIDVQVNDEELRKISKTGTATTITKIPIDKARITLAILNG